MGAMDEEWVDAAGYAADVANDEMTPEGEAQRLQDGILSAYRTAVADAEHFTASLRGIEDEMRTEAVREASAFLARLTRRSLMVKALWDEIEAERRRVALHVDRLKSPVVETILVDLLDPDTRRIERLGGKTVSNDAAVGEAIGPAGDEGYDIETIIARLGTHPIVTESANPAKVVANHLSSMVQRGLAVRVGRGRYRHPHIEDTVPF